MSTNGNHPDTDPDELAAPTPRTALPPSFDERIEAAVREHVVVELQQLHAVQDKLVPRVESAVIAVQQLSDDWGEHERRLATVEGTMKHQAQAFLTLDATIKREAQQRKANDDAIAKALEAVHGQLVGGFEGVKAAVARLEQRVAGAERLAEEADEKAEVTGQHAFGAAVRMAEKLGEVKAEEAKARTALASKVEATEIEIDAKKRKKKIEIVYVVVSGLIALFLAWLAGRLGVK